MNANNLRTVIISRDDLVDVSAALTKLRNGEGLTDVESGVVAEEPIANLTLVGTPYVRFDGFKWDVFLYVTTG